MSQNKKGILVIIIIFCSFYNCSRKSSSFESAPTIRLNSACPIGSSVVEVIDCELALGSSPIYIPADKTTNYTANWLFLPQRDHIKYNILFRRQSQINTFNEYIIYYFDRSTSDYFISFDSIPPGALSGSYFFYEFNCGTEPFGYDTTKANIKYYWKGRYPGLTPVRDVPLDSFKLGYYSIVKWLYAQETDRYKVKRKDYEHFDSDYHSNPSVTPNDVVLEDPWQEEFLFNAYELIDTRSGPDYGYPILTIEPYTLAPIGLYEVRVSKNISKREKYHINVADMAIRVYRYPTFEEMKTH